MEHDTLECSWYARHTTVEPLTITQARAIRVFKDTGLDMTVLPNEPCMFAYLLVCSGGATQFSARFLDELLGDFARVLAPDTPTSVTETVLQALEIRSHALLHERRDDLGNSCRDYELGVAQ